MNRILSGLFVMACASCSTHTPSPSSIQTVSYTTDAFEVIDLSQERSEEVSADSMLMGRPFEIRVVSDSLLAINDAGAEKLLWLLNPHTHAFSACVDRGEGPEEMLFISNLWMDGQTLCAGGMQDNKIVRFNFTSSPLAVVPQQVCRTSFPFIRAASWGEDGYLVVPMVHQSDRYYTIDSAGNVQDTVGVYPEVLMPEEIQPNNSMFQTRLAVSPDRSHLVSANQTWNTIEVYDATFQSTLLLKGPIEMETEVKKIESPIGVRYGQKPGWNLFCGVSATDSGFWVGYIGMRLEKREDVSRGISAILSFAWDGTPRRMYRLGEEVVAFDIDEQGNALYAIANRPDPTIVRYSLPAEQPSH